MINWFDVNPNATRFSIVWCTDSWKISDKINVTVPCKFEKESSGEMIFYTIWTNKSLTPDYLLKPLMMPLPKDQNLL